MDSFESQFDSIGHRPIKSEDLHFDSLLAENDGDLDKTFGSVCRGGNLDLAKWIYENKEDLDVDACDWCAFRSACAAGQYDVVVWLYPLLSEIPFGVIGHAFACACAEGRQEVAKWLFEKTTEEKWTENEELWDQAFQWAAQEDKFTLLKWLFSKRPGMKRGGGIWFASTKCTREVFLWLSAQGFDVV